MILLIDIEYLDIYLIKYHGIKSNNEYIQIISQ